MENERDERISFGVEILSDGQVIFQDAPGEILEMLKKLYPDDPKIKEVEKVVEEVKESRE